MKRFLLLILIVFNISKFYAQTDKTIKKDTLITTVEDSTKVKELARLTKIKTSIAGSYYLTYKLNNFLIEVKDSLTGIKKSIAKISSKIEEKKKRKNKLSPFQFSMGFSFDFLNGISAQDLYADINVNIPFVFKKKEGYKIKNQCFQKTGNSLLQKLGIEFGVSQMRTATSVDSVYEEFRIIDSEKLDTNLIKKYITVNSIYFQSVKRENLNVYINPKYNLINNGEDDKITNLSLLTHFGWKRSIVTSTQNRSYTHDTSLTVPNNWPRPYEIVNKLPIDDNKKIRFEEYSSVVGIGFDLLVIKPSGTFHFKPILGLNWLRRKSFNNSVTKFEKYKRRLSYLIQAEIITNKLFGIKMGAEVRGFYSIKNKDKYPLGFKVPQYTIYIAKTFSLEKIAEFFKT